MSASIVGIRTVNGAPDIERGYNCFVCSRPDAGFDLAVYVEPKSNGEKLTHLFNKIVKGSAWLDYREKEPYYIQVKIFACRRHYCNLGKLKNALEKIPGVPVPCFADKAITHVSRTVTEAMIQEVRK